jgi:hypothetical protein
MVRIDLVGTWRQETQDGRPLDPQRCGVWVLSADGTATVAHLGLCTWLYADGQLTIESAAHRTAAGPVPRVVTRYEVVRLSTDRLDLRFAPDERMRGELFGPAIRRLPPDAEGISRKSLRAGLVPWALDYPGGRTATVYLPDDGRGQDAVAELLATVERHLLAVVGYRRLA